jgi:hypothetical protein
MAETPRTQDRKASGRTLTVAQKMAYEAYAVLSHALKGLLGEHIVDHYVIEKKSWGMQWNRHDMIAVSRAGKPSGWQSNYKKIKDDEIPLNISWVKLIPVLRQKEGGARRVREEARKGRVLLLLAKRPKRLLPK